MLKLPKPPYIEVTRKRTPFQYANYGWSCTLFVGDPTRKLATELFSRRCFLWKKEIDALLVALWWAESMVWKGVPVKVIVRHGNRSPRAIWSFDVIGRVWWSREKIGSRGGRQIKARTRVIL